MEFKGGRISPKKLKLSVSFRIFVVEESLSQGNSIKNGPRKVSSGELLAEVTRKTPGKDRMSPKKDSERNE